VPPDSVLAKLKMLPIGFACGVAATASVD
jgi:hypothetical protein